MRIVIFSGRHRRTFDLKPDRQSRIAAATDLKRFLFPTNAGYHKAKRRGERALGLRPAGRYVG